MPVPLDELARPCTQYPCLLPIAEASRDPAWLTASVLAGLPIVYSMLVG